MKKASMLLLCVMVILVLVLVSGYPQKLWVKDEPVSSSSANIFHSTPKEPSSQESSEVDVMVGKEDFYTVREYNGHIGVFRNEETEPFEEIQVDVDLFPEIDRELLKEGIKAYTPEELNGVIEDYEG